MSLTRIILAILLVALPPAAAVGGQEHQHAGTAGERLGKVHFATSCGPAVGAEFDRAVALLHSFWYSAAIQAFGQVAAKDPGCAMAHWGAAMSHWSNPFGGFRSPAALERGRAAVEKAKAAGAKTQRERDYIAAVEQLYASFEKVDQRTRTLAYEKAMEQVYRSYPDDQEAAIFYALAVDQTALLTDKTYANQLKAAAILEKLFVEQPEHPGLAHYIIHSYDVPALAPRAVDAARRYAKIAPSAPHALHMPSHTFTRVGYWQDSIDTNIASAVAARKDGATAEELHAMDYQTYAYLQTAQDRAAGRLIGQLAEAGGRLDVNAPGAAAPGAAGLFALAAMPARYALERSAWREAAALQPGSQTAPSPGTGVFPTIAEAITRFARALGAARSGDAVSARQDIARLAALRDALTQAKDEYWAQQVEIQRKAAEAWTLRAEDHQEAAIATLRAAADLEDATDKSAITPGPLAPTREMLGEMLLEAQRPGDALKEFEATMKKEPNRLRGTYGAARAAELSGDRAKATAYYRKLVDICRAADNPDRAELRNARNFLAKS